jgi:acyl-CoA reductase-like NAD-dependent aldehyde dehydrogenase
MGDTAIPSDAIGCPMRLAYDKNTKEVKFSANGKPVIRVESHVQEAVKMVRDNFQANLLQYAGEVMTNHSEEYAKQLEMAEKLGKPIADYDKAELSKAIAIREEIAKEAELKATQEATEATQEAVLVS